MTPHKKLTLIIAGTHSQAKYWAEQWNLGRDWVFINEPRQLYGIRGADIRFAGTWYSRPDAEELEMEVQRVRLR